MATRRQQATASADVRARRTDYTVTWLSRGPISHDSKKYTNVLMPVSREMIEWLRMPGIAGCA